MSAVVDRRKLTEVRCGRGDSALRVYVAQRADGDRFVELQAYDADGARVVVRLGSTNAARVADALDAALDELGGAST